MKDKDHNAALLPGEPLASPPTTEALPNTWCEHCQSWRGNPYCGRVDCPSPEPTDYDKPLDVTIERNALVIRIGIGVLAHAVTYSDWANPWNEAKGDYIREFAITDAVQFTKDVANMMKREEEDGSSLLTNFIDKASEEAVNDGSLGLHEDEQEIKHGEKSPLEAW